MLTLKGPASKDGLAREEYEMEITHGQYYTLRHVATASLYKIRYSFWIKQRGREHAVDLDIFQGSLGGLVLAEVEFDSVTDAKRFKPLAWFGTEVTGDKRFSNIELAKHNTNQNGEGR